MDYIKGPYDKIMKWVEENNLNLDGTFIETYYNGPDDVSEENLITKIIVPLK